MMIFRITGIPLYATLLAALLPAATAWAEGPREGQEEVSAKVLARRQRERDRRAVARAYTARRQAIADREAREYQARMAPVLAAREAAWRRDVLEARRVQAEQLQAVAAMRQAEAQRRLADAITYEAYVAAGRRYRYP